MAQALEHVEQMGCIPCLVQLASSPRLAQLPLSVLFYLPEPTQVRYVGAFLPTKIRAHRRANQQLYVEILRRCSRPDRHRMLTLDKEALGGDNTMWDGFHVDNAERW